MLGACTYSIYLLHPFVPVLTTRVLGSGWLGYVSAAWITIMISWATYRWFELPLMRLGKRLALSSEALSEQGTRRHMGGKSVNAQNLGNQR